MFSKKSPTELIQAHVYEPWELTLGSINMKHDFCQIYSDLTYLSYSDLRGQLMGSSLPKWKYFKPNLKRKYFWLRYWFRAPCQLWSFEKPKFTGWISWNVRYMSHRSSRNMKREFCKMYSLSLICSHILTSRLDLRTQVEVLLVKLKNKIISPRILISGSLPILIFCTTKEFAVWSSSNCRYMSDSDSIWAHLIWSGHFERHTRIFYPCHMLTSGLN